MGVNYSIGKRGRPCESVEAASCDVVAEFCGAWTRPNEQNVAERLAVAIRELWDWHKFLQTNPS
jgi:hypothetical protein